METFVYYLIVFFNHNTGTYNDLPPSHQNQFKTNGPIIENVRIAMVGTTPFQIMQNDMKLKSKKHII